jgi:dTDP-4-amino-4,6-dideoxygalactose transaminase
MTRLIPVANPRAQYLGHQTEIDVAIAAALDGNRSILGPQTQAFEQEFAAYLGVRYASGVGSGTEALHVAIRACGLGSGDDHHRVAYRCRHRSRDRVGGCDAGVG